MITVVFPILNSSNYKTNSTQKNHVSLVRSLVWCVRFLCSGSQQAETRVAAKADIPIWDRGFSMTLTGCGRIISLQLYH